MKLKAENTWRCKACQLRLDIRDETTIAGSNTALQLWMRAIHAVIRSSPKFEPEDLVRQTRLNVAAVRRAQLLVVHALVADNRILRAGDRVGIPADEFDRALGRAQKIERSAAQKVAEKAAKLEARSRQHTKREYERRRQ